MEEKVFFEGDFGKICGVLHSVEVKNEVVIVIHGFSSNKESSAKSNSEKLNEIGINSLRIDLDNQGESDLDFKTKVSIPHYVQQVEAAITFVQSKGYKEISLLGTSFGGIVALATALNHPEIKRLFLRAPVLDYQKHLEKKLGEKIEECKREKRIPHFNKAGEKTYFNFNCYETAKDYSMFEQAPRIKQPIMIIQGDKDLSVDYHVAEEVVGLFLNAELKIIKGAGHNLGVDNDFSEGISIMKNFFSE